MLSNVLTSLAKTRNINRTIFALPFARILRKVYAESGTDDKDGESTSTLNFEDLITKARQEEKNKLYPQIEDLKKKNKVLTEANNGHLLTIADLEEQVKKINEQLTNTKQGDPQEVIDLKKQLSDTLKLVDGLRDELKTKPEGTTEELRQTIEAEVKEAYEVKLYRIQKLQESGDAILMPELVVGDTKGDVDKSIAAAIAQTKAIKTKLGVSEDEADKNQKSDKGEDAGEKQPQIRPKPNAANPAGRGVNSLGDLDPSSIRDMSDEEYAEWRKQAGLGKRR